MTDAAFDGLAKAIVALSFASLLLPLLLSRLWLRREEHLTAALRAKLGAGVTG